MKNDCPPPQMHALATVIRPATHADLQTLWAIEQECYAQGWSREQLRLELEQPAGALDLCCVGPRIAGYICYWLIAGELQILNVATASAFRRRGVAALLLEHALSRCASRGLDSAWLEVRAGNTAAIALYQRFGFVVEGRRPAYYRDGEDALLMGRFFQ
jgi:ribosomal-protein-alanine N-acetyltransferase